VLFLLFDGATKAIREPHVLAASAQLGFPENTIVTIGILLIIFTVVYAIPHTSILGAILLTGYLGGATASQVRIGNPLFETLFPVIFSALIWAGILLREDHLRTVVGLKR
jgi:hypothetical protein